MTKTTTSYSEVSSYISCRRKHYYNYTLNLERIESSDALSEGKIGHSVLEAFYRFILASDNQHDAMVYGDAAQHAYDVLAESGYKFDPDGKRADLGQLLEIYFTEREPFVRNGWTVLAVEREFDLKWGDAVGESYKFVIDLIARDPDGAVVIIDHKFTGMFDDGELVDLKAQIPLYIGALRGLGLPADYGIYNQLMTKRVIGKRTAEAPNGTGPTPEQAHRLQHDRPSPERIVRTFQEQVGLTREVIVRRMMSVEQADATAYRVGNIMVCRGCSFKQICSAELMGARSDLVLRTQYKTKAPRALAV